MNNHFFNHKKIEGDIDMSSVEILETIGSGNSSVYSARVNQKILALKEIVINSEQQAISVHKQIQLMKHLSSLNPNIIKYEGYFFTIRQMGIYNKIKFAYILMEKGIRSLQSLIQTKKKYNQCFKEQQIINIFGTLIETLLFLQENNVAHCDIKPENVLIMNMQKMEIKICDIGSCKVIEKQQTEESTLVGTVPFLAPQLIKNYGKHKATNNAFKSDVYSLGLCLIYLITFKKFKSNERLKIEEKIYKQVIMQWIKQSKQRTSNQNLFCKLLDSMLQFDEKNRVKFNQLKNIFDSALQIKQNQKKQLLKWAEKKLEEEELEKDKLSMNSIPLFSSTILVQQTPKEKQIKKLNKTIGGFKDKKHPLKIQTTKSQHLQARNRVSSKVILHSPVPQTINPIVKKNTIIIQVPESQSPMKSKKSSPQKPLQKQKLQVVNSLIFMNKKIMSKVEDLNINWENKSLTLNVNYWQYEKIKSLCLLINENFVFFQNLENLDKFIGLKTLILSMKSFIGVVDQKKFEDKQQKLKDLTKLCLILNDTDITNYKNLFQMFFIKSIQKIVINLQNSKISNSDLLSIIQNIASSSCQYLHLVLDSLNIDQKMNKSIIQNLSKSQLTSLSLYLQDNNINLNALMPWPLPKTLTSLTLNYKNNKIGIALNSLCLSFMKSSLKYLNLNFSNSNLRSSEINFLFTYIINVPKLETLILNLSYNKIDDQTIKYIVSKSQDIFVRLQTFQFQIYGTDINVENWSKIITLLDRCFTKFKLKTAKISYDRFSQKSNLMSEIKKKISNESVKIDIICINNEYFTAFFRNKLPLHPNQIQKGFCHRLHANYTSSHHFICLTCKQEKQTYKNRYFCEFCIMNCNHQNHNYIKMQGLMNCTCAYSGECKSDLNQFICSANYKESIQKGFYCLKCNKQQICISCIIDCKKIHEDYVKQYKQLIYFECKHQKMIEKMNEKVTQKSIQLS